MAAATPLCVNKNNKKVTDFVNYNQSNSKISKFITTIRNAQLLVLDDYTFYKTVPIGRACLRYSCTYKHCRSYVHVTSDNVIVTVCVKHNHPPTKFVMLEDGRYVKAEKYDETLDYMSGSVASISEKANFIRTVRDTKLLLHDNYTFYKSGPASKRGVRYVCTYNKPRCKSHVQVRNDNMIVSACLNHKHPPPNYIQMGDGRYANKDSNFTRRCKQYTANLGKATFITTDRGTIKLIFDDNTFFKSGKELSDGSRRYICSKYPYGCKAVIHVDKDNIIVSYRSTHSHMPVIL